MTDHLKHSGRRSARIEHGLAASEDHEPSATLHRDHAGDELHPVHDGHGLHARHIGGGGAPHPHNPDELNPFHDGHGEGTPGFHSTEHSHVHSEELHR
jgi:hypothetical protein